jgi:hypothetical protein
MALPNKHALYIHSAPLTRQFLDEVVEMRLFTVSGALGVYNGDDYLEEATGFAIGILRPLGPGPNRYHPHVIYVKSNSYFFFTASYAPLILDGNSAWMSHKNEPFHTAALRGDSFGPDHDMWEFLRERDIICVYALARRKSKNIVDSGRLVMYERFDPTRILKGGT